MGGSDLRDHGFRSSQAKRNLGTPYQWKKAVPVITATARSIKWEVHGSGWLGQIARPYLQNNQK
jgi:hypothetical protein